MPDDATVPTVPDWREQLPNTSVGWNAEQLLRCHERCIDALAAALREFTCGANETRDYRSCDLDDRHCRASATLATWGLQDAK